MGGLTNDVRRFWWAVLAIALLTIVTRLPSLLHPQAIDDEVAPIAQLIWCKSDMFCSALRRLLREND